MSFFGASAAFEAPAVFAGSPGFADAIGLDDSLFGLGGSLLGAAYAAIVAATAATAALVVRATRGIKPISS